MRSKKEIGLLLNALVYYQMHDDKNINQMSHEITKLLSWILGAKCSFYQGVLEEMQKITKDMTDEQLEKDLDAIIESFNLHELGEFGLIPSRVKANGN